MTHPPPDDLVFLAAYDSPAEAGVVRGLLESCGIASHVARGRGVASPDAFDLLPLPIHPFESKSPAVRLLVRRDDLAAAREILAGTPSPIETDS